MLTICSSIYFYQSTSHCIFSTIIILLSVLSLYFFSINRCYASFLNTTYLVFIKTLLVVQWFNALATMAMLSARTWVWVPPTTGGVFSPVTRFLHSTIESQRYLLCYVPQLSSPRLSGVTCKKTKQRNVITILL